MTGLLKARVLGLVVVAALAPTSATALAAQPAVSWSPERPVQGTVFVVRASGAAPTGGSFAGERLHFQPADSGGHWALAAVPIDSAGSLQLTVTFPEPVAVSVPIARGAYRLEKLTVAPQYTALSPELERRTQEESAKAIAVARGAHETPVLWRASPWQRPRTTRITSGFGNGREFNGRVESRHMGTDFQGAVGQPVLAPAKGVVRLTGQFYLGGNVIYVDHGGGLSSAYLHLSQQLVKQGDTVQAGQRIGLVGATGRVTGPHLHWIVRYGNVSVDPLSWVGLQIP